MKTRYNSHILKFDGINGERDCRRLSQILEQCRGNKVLLRLRQDGVQFEWESPPKEIQREAQAKGFNLSRPFFVAVITRDPANFQLPNRGDSYLDANDFQSSENSAALSSLPKLQPSLRG